MISATHIHAMVIHFPIALLMVGFLSEVLAFITQKDFFKNTAFFLLLLGALGATAAYISGGYAGEGIEDGPLKTPMELHEGAALLTLLLSIMLAMFRVAIYFFKYNKIWTKWFGIILFAILIGSVVQTAYLGGQLVYTHGAGVELTFPGADNSAAEE